MVGQEGGRRAPAGRGHLSPQRQRRLRVIARARRELEAIGWPSFFIVAMCLALPSLIWLRALWRPIEALDVR